MIENSPEHRPDGPSLVAFISSVMDDEMSGARRTTRQALTRFPGMSAWTFEDAPASAEAVKSGYLREVRDADLVIWLVGSRSTEPVAAEVREALASVKPLLVFKLPADHRDAATESLLAEIGDRCRWKTITSPESLESEVLRAVQAELGRAYKGMPSMSREDRLMELRRESRARMLDRWQAAGVSDDEAEDLASDLQLGAAPDEILPALPARPVVVFAADLGAGKSLAGERAFQDAVTRALTNASAPIPVYLDARTAARGLRDAAQAVATGLGDPRQQGAFIVVDGADEAGFDLGAGLLRDARRLTGTWPSTTVLIDPSWVRWRRF